MLLAQYFTYSNSISRFRRAYAIVAGDPRDGSNFEETHRPPHMNIVKLEITVALRVD